MSVPGRHPRMTRSPKSMSWAGNFTGVNNDVSNVVVDAGVTVARTEEGEFTITFPGPIAGFKFAYAKANDPGEFHDVTWALDADACTMVITHVTCAFADIVTGPAASDVVANIHFEVVVELSDVPGTGL